MRLEETILNFNITVHISGDSSEEARIQIESLPPMGKEAFWDFLLRRAKAGELPRTSRPSREVWRDTKESPQPRSKLIEMDEFAKEYKKLKRRFPQADNELLAKKTSEMIEMRKKVFEDFKKNLDKLLSD